MKDAKTLYICSIWGWEAIKGGLQPQSCHHGIIYTRQWPRIAKIWPSRFGVTICPQTSVKDAKTLHISSPIWMWEVIKGGLQPQWCHHGIFYTGQWPRIAEIWPSLVGVTEYKEALTCPSISLKVLKITLNISNIDVRSNQRWPTASIMMSWHHFHWTVTPNCKSKIILKWGCYHHPMGQQLVSGTCSSCSCQRKKLER